MLFLLPLLLLSQVPTVQAHAKQVQTNGDLEITYFSNPPDPITNSPATLYIQVRNITSNLQLRVLHFLVVYIPPGNGPRVIGHPFSNSTIHTFDQPGNWLLSIEIGLRNLADFDTLAAFIADVSPGETAGVLAAFASVLVVEIPKVYARWGHILAVVLWLGMMLHIVNTYRLFLPTSSGPAGFARTYKRADIVVGIAIGLLSVTGIIRAFAHGLTTIPSLFQSDFGLVLFAMIVLAGGMIAIGLFNRIVLLNRLEKATATVPDGTVAVSQELVVDKARQLARRMYYLTLLEMGLGAAAILFGTIFTQIHTIT